MTNRTPPPAETAPPPEPDDAADVARTLGRGLAEIRREFVKGEGREGEPPSGTARDEEAKAVGKEKGS